VQAAVSCPLLRSLMNAGSIENISLAGFLVAAMCDTKALTSGSAISLRVLF
jgi:hypothetical protein